MKVFHCDHCGHLLFFENIQCVQCNHCLAYLPELDVVGSLEAAGEGLWTSPLPRAEGRKWRLCENYTVHNVCNWGMAADDPNPLCRSCRLTRVIPNLDRPGNKEAWYRLEVAKRRLVYTLLHLRLPLRNRDEDPEQGLVFEFGADPEPGAQLQQGTPFLTGHANGLITINIAEADDAERERRRVSLHEPYRTLLGHFRHEVGHYYWDRLIRDTDRLHACRERFGDERADYGEALKHHYAEGPPPDWRDRFVSAYAAAHPWEDWAETWAHYLHMTDTLETASTCGLSLRPRRKDEPALPLVSRPDADDPGAFDRMMLSWFAVTYVLNNLNRGMGLPDGYPFVLSTPAIDKLRFVHETIVTAK